MRKNHNMHSDPPNYVEKFNEIPLDVHASEYFYQEGLNLEEKMLMKAAGVANRISTDDKSQINNEKNSARPDTAQTIETKATSEIDQKITELGLNSPLSKSQFNQFLEN